MESSSILYFYTHSRCSKWKAPERGCFKINTDGACQSLLGIAASGGILRDYKGEVKGGFMFNIGQGGSFLAEVWGILMGLRCAWDLGVRSVVLETDCLEAVVECLEDDRVHGLEVSHIFYQIRDMLKMDWDVRIEWVRRDCNNIADKLAHRALHVGQGVVGFIEVPDFIAEEVDQEKLLCYLSSLVLICNPKKK